MKLSKKSKSFYSLFKYISVVFYSAMFFYLMIDVWDKFNNQMTNMGVRFTGEDVKEKLLPCLGMHSKKEDFFSNKIIS